MDNVEQIVYKHLRNAITELVDNIEYIIKSKFYEYVTDFYNDYHPIYYVRFGSPLTKKDGLYNAMQFKRQELDFDWETNSINLPKHKQDNSKVYNLVFEKGLHGGIQTFKGYATPIFSPSIDELIQSFWDQWLPQLENFGSAFHAKMRKECVLGIGKEVLVTYGKR